MSSMARAYQRPNRVPTDVHSPMTGTRGHPLGSRGTSGLFAPRSLTLSVPAVGRPGPISRTPYATRIRVS
jgi:hypothetical protein